MIDHRVLPMVQVLMLRQIPRGVIEDARGRCCEGATYMWRNKPLTLSEVRSLREFVGRVVEAGSSAEVPWC